MKPALPRPLRIGGLALLALVYLILIPVYFGASPYILRVISTASVLSVISLGVWLTFAIGRINLGQAAFALIGGYATAILSTRWGLSYWLCLPLSGVLAATAGTILGFGILRLRGVYFAMITLSLTEAVRLAFLNGGELTGGASGIPIIPLPDQVALFGLVLIPSFDAVNTHRAFYYLAACLLILTLARHLADRHQSARLDLPLAAAERGSGHEHRHRHRPVSGSGLRHLLLLRRRRRLLLRGRPAEHLPQRLRCPRLHILHPVLFSWRARLCRRAGRRRLHSVHRFRDHASAAAIPAVDLRGADDRDHAGLAERPVEPALVGAYHRLRCARSGTPRRPAMTVHRSALCLAYQRCR